MDFKIAGAPNGVTAIQLDIKPAGIPLDIICECLEPALKGRLQILDRMEQKINAPRTQDDINSPPLATLKFSNDALRRLIGPMGALKRKIEEGTCARISVSDGALTIVAKNQSVMERVQEKIAPNMFNPVNFQDVGKAKNTHYLVLSPHFYSIYLTNRLTLHYVEHIDTNGGIDDLEVLTIYLEEEEEEENYRAKHKPKSDPRHDHMVVYL
ncbi:polyribonucleotide nucleotidyltransferase 2, mitochondrial-like [Malania oleifera]|uniref:polyribonucleotide nucleotidyltransferase 2, mitochondrial-like n=1 Tax=Malania oleifera TaxID=397392 RepID=UPI0025AEB6DE|nr:polyribonucleotide nucleotidyltransferase 2, mitochondrial-like [Malania oleifera]